MKRILALVVTALIVALSAPAVMAAPDSFKSLVPCDKAACFRSMPWGNPSVPSMYITAPEHGLFYRHPVYYWYGGDIYGPISFDCAAPVEVADADFVVFFDFDMSNIKADQVQTLEDALAYAKKFEDAPIVLDGFADFRGTNEYNLALSKRRTASVKAWLVDNGIDEARITEEGRGELGIRGLLGRFCKLCFKDRKVTISIK